MATRPIDEKIVAMKMDNSDFIQKASETTKSMGLLTKFLNMIPGINLGKTANDFKNINTSANSIDTARLANGVDTIAGRFSALGIIGTTALVNIANKAVDAGTAMLKSMTVTPILDGFHEYETKIGSIQTILANTSKFGTGVDDITKALGQLNDYADKTIYSFGDMTKNIGLFTNAGLKLEESVSMIKGFSNAAASSGANAQQMAGAAYQLSQGLSSGVITLMDWNSLVTAGIGNDNMKRDLVNMGAAMGTLKKSASATFATFRDSLADDRWLTKEVFSKYLQAMAGDLDKAKLKTIGLTDAQADLLIANAKMGEKSATQVRTFTQMIGTIVESVGSGWADTWEIIFGGFTDATQLWTGFTELISAPFNELTKSRNKFVQSLKDQGVIENMFVALGTAVYVVGQAIAAMTGGFNKAFSGDKVAFVTSLVSGFNSLVTAITPSEASLVKMATIFEALGTGVRVVIKVVSLLGSALLGLIPPDIGTNVLDILEKFAKMSITFNQNILNSKTLENAFKGLGSVFSLVGKGADYIGGKLVQLTSLISDTFKVLSTGDSSTVSTFSKNSGTVMGLTAINTAAVAVIERIKNIKLSLDPVFNAFKSFFSAIGTGFNWVKEKLSGIGTAIKDAMPSGTTLFAGGFVAAMVTVTGIIMKTMYDITKIFSGWGNVVKGFAETLDSVSNALDSFALNLKANALLTASIAIGALSVSILILSRVDGSKIGSSLAAMAGSLTAVISAMAVMNKFDITGGIKVATSIVGMAIAVSVLATAMQKFGKMNPEELTKGLIALTVAMGAIAGSFALMGKFGKMDNTATAMQIVAMSASVLLMAKAVKTLGSMNITELITGIGGLALIMASLAGAFALMGKFGNASVSALQLVAIAGSVLLLVGAIKLISTIHVKDLLIGLGTITAILAVISGFATLTSGTGLLASSVGLIAIAVAINALIIPLFALGSFPLDKLAIGLLGMSAALMAIAIASRVMMGSIAGAASIAVMAIALNLLLVPIGVFAAMGWGPMLIGIAGLALSLAALAGVALLLAPGAVPLLLFSAAIGGFGLAMLAAGAGMTLFSAGLLAMVGMTAAAVTAIITTLGALITGIASLIPSAVNFAISLVKQVAIAIRDNAPQILTIIAQTIVNVLTTISTYVPQFIGAAVKIITSLMDGLASEAPKLIASVVNLIVTMVETMANTIDQNGPRFINAFVGLIGSVLKILVEANTSIIKALFGWIPGVNGALDKVGKTAEEAIAGALDTARIGQEKGSDFAKGIASQKSSAQKSGEDISKSADDGLKSVDSKKSGEFHIMGFISGLLGRKKDVEEAAGSMAGAADDSMRDRLGIHSPGVVGQEIGEFHGDGVALGMGYSTKKIEASSKGMATAATSGFGSIIDKVRGMLYLDPKDVKDNNKKVDQVVDTYSGAGDKIKKKTKGALDEAFQNSKDWIDEQKYYHKLALNEELAAWERVQARYLAGTEERKQADREVFRVQEEIIKDNFKTFKDKLDDRKYYNDLSLEDELTNWQYAQNVYLAGTEERKQADKEVYRVQQELLKKKKDDDQKSFNFSKDWIDERKNYAELSLKDELAAWQRVQERYISGTEERKQADKEVYRVKNEINKKLISLNSEYVKKVQDINKSLIDDEKKLNDQYENTYKDRVKSLTNFVGLFDKVKEQDPKNPVTGTGLVDNLRGQVNAFATWSDDIKRLSQKGIDEGLLKQLEEMGPSASNEIKALNDLTAGQLDEYVGLWKTKNALAKTQATTELIGLRKETNDQIDKLREDTAASLDFYKTEWLRSVSEIRVGTRENFIGLNDDMNKIGVNAIKGLMDGMSDMQSPINSKVKEIAEGIANTIRETLDIHSPSRVMMGLGQFAGEGLANGLFSSAKTVTNKSKELALTAVDSINKFISTFQQPTFDNEIRLKAVLDDSDINSKLNGLSDTKVPYYLGTTNALVDSAKVNIRQNGSKVPSVDGSKGVPNNPSSNTDSKQPLVIQSILNGRVIAEETVDDISQLMGYRTNLDFSMKGV